MTDSQRKRLTAIVGVGLVLLGGVVCFLEVGKGNAYAPVQAQPKSDGVVGNSHADVAVISLSNEPPRSLISPVMAFDAPVAETRQEVAGRSAVDEDLVRKLKSSTLRPREFQTRIRSIAIRGDSAGVETLIALSDEHYEELAIVEALGEVRRQGQRQRVGTHLRGKIADRPLRVMMAAYRSYARVMEDEAIPVLTESIHEQWRRPDGFGEMVCKAAIQAMGGIPSQAAQTALIAELERVNEPGWLPDYGSAVVEELGKRRSAEASAALQHYADALEKRMPPENNPPGRAYYEEKIEEARRAASGWMPPVTDRHENQEQGMTQ